jgi:hypothetical protein
MLRERVARIKGAGCAASGDGPGPGARWDVHNTK